MDAVAGTLSLAEYSDPIISLARWVIALMLVLLVGAKPLSIFLRQRSSDKTEETKDRAEVTLYTHLSEQITQYRTLADRAFGERNELLIRVTKLEFEVEQFTGMKILVERLQARIEKKDETIAKMVSDGMEERKRFLDILQVKDTRIEALESSLRGVEDRLTRDEAVLGVTDCPLCNKAAG